MIANLVAGHYNALVVQVLAYMDQGASSHGAYWQSSILPWSAFTKTSFDPLAYLCQKAHANGIEVHAWLGGSAGAMYRVSTTWPPSMKMTSWAPALANPTSCVTTTIVLPSDARDRITASTSPTAYLVASRCRLATR